MSKLVPMYIYAAMAGLVMVSAAAPSIAPVIPAAVALPVVVGGPPCDTYCDQGACDDGEHLAAGVGPQQANSHENEGWHIWPECETGECQYTHGPLCGGSDIFAAADLQGLVQAIRLDHSEDVRGTLSRHGSQVAMNPARSAIQVADCTGQLYAHLPISSSMARKIATDPN